MTLDMTKLEPLLGMMVNEIGAAANAALVLTGDKLGLYRALAGKNSPRPASRKRPARASATCASGCPPRRRPVS